MNLATENHNFHMHQTKFRVAWNGARDARSSGGTTLPATGGILEDNVPLSVAVPKNADYIINYQNGYCTIAQWYNATCASKPLFVDIPFSQLGEFVFHCHILEHEDGGMMAKIQVVPSPSATNTHDYNGDGKSDIVWRDQIGDAAVWLMNGATPASAGGFAGVPTTWSIVGHRDFDGDGNYDLLWRDTSGNTAIWFLNGTQIVAAAASAIFPSAGRSSPPVISTATARATSVWQDASGNLAVWLMNGAAVASAGGLGNVPAAWSLVGAGDFDGDGKSDLLWRDASGNIAIWFMNGTQVASMAGVGNVPSHGRWSAPATSMATARATSSGVTAAATPRSG